jgi:hypothetical protein
MKKTTIAVSFETKKILKEVQTVLEKVSGKKFSYDDTVFFLLDYFVNSRMEEDSSQNCKTVVDILENKKELILNLVGTGDYRGNEELRKKNYKQLSYQEIKRNFFYVPDPIVEKINKLAVSGRKFPIAVFLRSLETGVFLQDKFFLAVRDSELNKKVAEVFSLLSREEQMKEIANIDKKFHSFVRKTVIELRQKYKSRLRRKR